jgi:transcriptional regulator with XRE-family HTH domain
MAGAKQGRTGRQNPGNPEQAFGQVLRKARERQSISQEALAFKGGYHRTYIGQLERGEKSPSLRTIFALAGTFGIPASEMLIQVEQLLSRR